jgi:hypothetical protein
MGATSSKRRFETSESLRTALREHKEAICAEPPTMIISYWDVSTVDDMSRLFDGWEKFNQPLRWNTANVRSMRATFRGCTAFDQSLDWDTRACQDFGYMFEGCDGLNYRTIALDFSAIKSDIDYGLRAMFEGSRLDRAGKLALDRERKSPYSTGLHSQPRGTPKLVARNLRRPTVGPRFMPPSVLGVLVSVAPYSWVEFDGDGLWRAVRRHQDSICADPPTLVVTNWDVSKVRDMRGVFSGMPSFNQPLAWDVRLVENMGSMFAQAEKFNQSVDAWDVSNVTSMRSMFEDASAFDQPLSGWRSRVSRVEHMNSMFQGCSAFNRPIDWDTRSCKSFSYMFMECARMASRIRLDMTLAANAASLEHILSGTSGATLSVINANALVTAALAPVRTALDVQGPDAPAAQKHRTCLVCQSSTRPARPARPARHAPPCGHVVLCVECAKSDQKAPRLCPECGVEFDRTFFVNRSMRENDGNIPPDEDTCGICFSGLPVLAHRACGGSYCAQCWSSILKGSKKCPSCRAEVTSNDIFRTYFGRFVCPKIVRPGVCRPPEPRSRPFRARASDLSERG